MFTFTDAIVAAVAISAALWMLRRWAMTWGTTPQDLRRVWPGDELSPEACHVATRAISIAAPSDEVWSWIVQIGQDRAGFYSYAWLENLFLRAMPVVDRIVPEWQRRSIGDMVWMAPRDRYHGQARQTIVRLDPGRVLALASPADWGRLIRHERNAGGTWTFIVVPDGPHASRLIVRSRGPARPSLGVRLFRTLVFDPAHFIMERGMLRRIKMLAEHAAATPLSAAS